MNFKLRIGNLVGVGGVEKHGDKLQPVVIRPLGLMQKFTVLPFLMCNLFCSAVGLTQS